MISQKFFKYHLNAILWAAVIMLLCGMSGSSFPSFHWDFQLTFDKAVHIVFYAVLCLLIIIGQVKLYHNTPRRFAAVRVAVGVSFAYGVLVELLQAFVFFERTADLADMMANTIGSFAGVLLFYAIYGRKVLA